MSTFELTFDTAAGRMLGVSRETIGPDASPDELAILAVLRDTTARIQAKIDAANPAIRPVTN